MTIFCISMQNAWLKGILPTINRDMMGKTWECTMRGHHYLHSLYACNITVAFPGSCWMPVKQPNATKPDWWFGTFCTFPYIGNNHNNHPN